MVLGLIFAVVLAKGSVLKAVAMVLTGLLLSMVGSDLETGAGRMTFDIPELADGIGFANVAMGVFGFAEIIRNLELPPESRDIVQTKITGLMPTRQDLIDVRRCDRARNHAWLAPRDSAGRRRGDRVVCRLYLRKEDLQASVALRARRHRGRSGAGERQQRRRADRRSFRCSPSASRPTR